MITYQTENIGKSFEYRSNCHKNWVVPPHIHEYSEIAFTKKGVSTVFLDGVKHTVPENHLIFIMPNQIHEYSDETESTLRCAVFSNDFVPVFYASLTGQVLSNPVVDFSQNAQLLAELDKTLTADTVRLCGLLNLICDTVLKKSATAHSNSLHKHNAFRQVIEYVSAHFTEDISLLELSKKLGYNEKYLSSSLHALTGMNFRKFLSSYRIDYAKNLLRNDIQGRLRMTDVALQSGFSSINTFNRMFLSLCGMTPTEYKMHKRK